MSVCFYVKWNIQYSLVLVNFPNKEYLLILHIKGIFNIEIWFTKCNLTLTFGDQKAMCLIVKC